MERDPGFFRENFLEILKRTKREISALYSFRLYFTTFFQRASKFSLYNLKSNKCSTWDYSRLSSNSEANASELLDNLEEMYTRYTPIVVNELSTNCCTDFLASKSHLQKRRIITILTIQ